MVVTFYKCACGRTHSTWWGRYVAAPGCKIFTTQMVRERLFNSLLIDPEELRTGIRMGELP